MLLISFEHSKPGMRFTTFSTAQADPRDLDGLTESQTGLRLASLF